MKTKEYDYRATQKYIKENLRNISLMCNKKYDDDILVWLDSQDNKQGYLKALIRADMARQGFTRKDNEQEGEK